MNKVKLLVMDVDGTLTDGKINIGFNGELYKSFCCKDGTGIIRVHKAGIIPVILTSRKSEIVETRARELGIPYVLQGAGDSKLAILDNFIKHQNIKYNEIAYIGDDINDLDCMKVCGVTACPSDAVDEIKNISSYICLKAGGEGAVREFSDWLLRQIIE